MILSGPETVALARMGQTLRLARLRRNLSQSDFADRMGVARSSVCALEAGEAGVSIGTLLKAMTVLGYTDRVGELLASDPIGDDVDDVQGRRRAGRRSDVVAF